MGTVLTRFLAPSRVSPAHLFSLVGPEGPADPFPSPTAMLCVLTARLQPAYAPVFLPALVDPSYTCAHLLCGHRCWR